MIDWNIAFSVAMGISLYKIVANFVELIFETVINNYTDRK